MPQPLPRSRNPRPVAADARVRAAGGAGLPSSSSPSSGEEDKGDEAPKPSSPDDSASHDPQRGASSHSPIESRRKKGVSADATRAAAQASAPQRCCPPPPRSPLSAAAAGCAPVAASGGAVSSADTRRAAAGMLARRRRRRLRWCMRTGSCGQCTTRRPSRMTHCDHHRRGCAERPSMLPSSLEDNIGPRWGGWKEVEGGGVGAERKARGWEGGVCKSTKTEEGCTRRNTRSASAVPATQVGEKGRYWGVGEPCAFCAVFLSPQRSCFRGRGNQSTRTGGNWWREG